MKLLLSALFIASVFTSVFAQPEPFRLRIIDEETLEPVGQVEVYSSASQNLGKTNNSGRMALTAQHKGLIFIHPSYEVKSMPWSDFDWSSGKEQLIKLTYLRHSYDEMVVSGSRFSEKRKDLVQRVEVVNRRDIENANQTSTADLLQTSGNVMVQKSQLGGGSPIIRGFETNRVLIVVDGVRMNNAIYRGGHLQNVITVDNAMLEKYELVFGPGSVMYGSDALGGVMAFYTKNPVLSKEEGKVKTKANAYTRYMSAASGYSGHVDVSVGGKKFGSLTSVSYSNFGDLRQGAVRNPAYSTQWERPWYVERINGVDSVITNKDVNLQVGSAYQQYDVLQKFLYQPKDNQSHTLNIQLSNSSDIPRYDRLTQTKSGKPRFAEWYYGPQTRLMLGYTFTHQGTGFYDEMRFTPAYQRIEESRVTRRFQDVNKQTQLEQLNIVTLNLDLTKKIGEHELRYGLDGFYNTVNSTATVRDIVADTSSKGDTRYPDGGSFMRSVAAYVSHKWEIGEKLILNDGLRFTQVGLGASFIDTTFFPFPFSEVNQNNQALNGNLGVVYMPSAKWRITAGVGSGYRAPNVDDLGKVFESVPGSLIVPNPNLKPEFSYTGELGISHEVYPGLTLSATGYYTELVNALAVGEGQLNGQDSVFFDGQLSRVTTTTNNGSAYITGFEGHVLGKLNNYLSVNASVNYTYGRLRTDTTAYPMDHIPPVFGKVIFTARSGRFSSDFMVHYAGWKRLQDYNMVGEDNFANATADGMPEWYTFGLRLNYRFNQHFSAQLACENILDRNYRVFASNISAPGRNFIATLRFSL